MTTRTERTATELERLHSCKIGLGSDTGHDWRYMGIWVSLLATRRALYELLPYGLYDR